MVVRYYNIIYMKIIYDYLLNIIIIYVVYVMKWIKELEGSIELLIVRVGCGFEVYLVIIFCFLDGEIEFRKRKFFLNIERKINEKEK